MVIAQINANLKPPYVNRRNAVPEIPLHTPEEDRLKRIPYAAAPESPAYAPGSPAYAPGSPAYAPGSPAYAPESPLQEGELLNYQPTSPLNSPPPSNPSPQPSTPDFSLSNSADYERKTTDSPTIMKAGTRVHYRGDSKPEREWTIQKCGENRYTIDTMDLDNLKIEESLKIVKPEDIYEPGNFVYAPQLREEEFVFEPEQPAYVQPAYVQPPYVQPLSQYPQQDPAIHFAPVIKIFNEGNDMSQGDPLQVPTQQYVQPQPEEDGTMKEQTNHETVDFNKPLIVLKDT
jgi:hypothetical protein